MSYLLAQGRRKEVASEDEARVAAAMWRTDTYWFDVAIASFLLMLGHLYFGKFEQHRPYWRRLAKSLLGIVIVVMTTAFFGRTWTWVLIGLMGVALIVVHGWWLPKNGVNGLTAEPRDRYFELIGLDPDGKKRKREP